MQTSSYQYANNVVQPQPQNIPSGWCLPTILNFILLILGIIAHLVIYAKKKEEGEDVSIFSIFIGLIPSTILVTILYLLCRYDHPGWAWAFLIIQLLIITFSLILLITSFSLLQQKISQLHKNINHTDINNTNIN